MRDHDRYGDSSAPHAGAFAGVEAAWSDLRDASGGVPRRRDLDLTRIGEALPHAFLMSRVAPGIARLRVAGQAVSALLGMDPRGMPLSVFFSGAAREALAVHVAALFDGPALVDLPLSGRGRLGFSRRPGRLMLLPLLGDDGSISHAVGVLDVAARLRAGRPSLEIGPGALRCEILDAPLPRRRTDSLSATSSLRRAPPRPGMAEARQPFLRLVIDNG